MSDADRLAAVINKEWVAMYGGDIVSDVSALEKRVSLMARDRDCWVANAKANQKEYLRIEALHTPLDTSSKPS